jgi:hypothetical protein
MKVYKKFKIPIDHNNLWNKKFRKVIAHRYYKGYLKCIKIILILENE